MSLGPVRATPRRTLLAVVAAAMLLPAGADPLSPVSENPAAAVPRKATPTASFDRMVKQAGEAKEAGHLDEAVRLYREAIRLKPSWLEGHWLLGTLLYDMDQYQDARDAFRRVVNVRPKNGPAWGLKGLCEYQLKDYDRALSDLQRARTLGLGDREVASVVSYHAAILMNRIEQYEVAFEILRDFALAGADKPSVIEAFGLSVLRMPYLPSEAPPDKREMLLMAGRAGFMMAKGRRSAAGRQAFEELATRYPEAPNVHYAFGNYLVPEEPDIALGEFRRELRLQPNHVPALLQIAFEHIKRTNYQEALSLAQKAVELAPDLFAARNALGRALLELGQTDRAIEELETGVKLAPDSPDMYFALARAYQRAGRKDDADRARAQFLRLDKQFRTARTGPQSVGGKEAEPATPPPN
jgi:tetratricopeptide (TPR) repeat protein